MKYTNSETNERKVLNLGNFRLEETEETGAWEVFLNTAIPYNGSQTVKALGILRLKRQKLQKHIEKPYSGACDDFIRASIKNQLGLVHL